MAHAFGDLKRKVPGANGQTNAKSFIEGIINFTYDMLLEDMGLKEKQNNPEVHADLEVLKTNDNISDVTPPIGTYELDRYSESWNEQYSLEKII
ncbi:hypothetical protein SUGI_0132570 [Cryptomeria japonica]|nr:hypothetical protein SUGI_0132570 [Cryptomeria japonica]